MSNTKLINKILTYIEDIVVDRGLSGPEIKQLYMELIELLKELSQ